MKNLSIILLLLGALLSELYSQTVTSADSAQPSHVVSLSTDDMVAQNLKTEYLRSADNGQTIYVVGTTFAWIGLIAYVGGIISDFPQASEVGEVSLLCGIPVAGIGASKINESARYLNGRYQDPGSGWVPYFIGWGLEGVGILMIAGDLSKGGPSSLGDAEGDILGAAVVMLGGEICQLIAWNDFARRRHRANMYIRAIKMRMTSDSDYNHYAPGVFLGYDF